MLAMVLAPATLALGEPLRGLMTSCNALVYEAILRVYRNAVVDLIRSRMQAAYPDDFENRVTSAFETWDDIVSSAARSAATGVVAPPHEDVFDYLDVSHFPLLLNNYSTSASWFRWRVRWRSRQTS